MQSYAEELTTLSHLHDGLVWVLNCPDCDVRRETIRVIVNEMCAVLSGVAHLVESEGISSDDT